MTRGRRLLGGLDGAVAILLVAADRLALPTRWWPVDATLLGLAALFATAAAGLLARAWWGRAAALLAGAVALACGLALATALALSAAHLHGLYGPVGQGGAVLLGAVAALLVPYLVVLPAAQLWVLLRPARRAT